MNLLWKRLEELPPTRFVLLLGLVTGTIQGIPTLLVSNAYSASGPLAQVLVVVASSGLWWCVALMFGGAAIRGVQFSWWRSASWMTLGWAVGDLLAFALAFVAAAIQTQGEYVATYIHAPFWSATLPGLVGPTLLRSPLRFAGSAAFLALGRFLLVRSALAPAGLMPGDRGAVT